MEKTQYHKEDLVKELNKAIEVLKKTFPNFDEGQLHKEDEKNYFKLFYSSGENNHTQKQKYFRIGIDAIFSEEVMDLYYSFEIADESKPFSWKKSEKFELEKLDWGGYVGNPSFNRWILLRLRERETEMKDKFNYLFENYVKVIGTEGITEPSKELFKIIVEGMLKKDYSKIIIIEISHTDQNNHWGNISKPISFAIFDWHDWLLFPEFCNEGDSGEGGSGYFAIKKFLEEKKKSGKIILWYKDIGKIEFREKILDYTPIKYKDYMPLKKGETLIRISTNNEIIDKIIEEINNCFNERLYLACSILMRKVIEESLIQKHIDLDRDKKREELRNSGVKSLIYNEKIRKIINNSHLLAGTYNIYHLESEGSVHGLPSFNPDLLKVESKIISNFLNRIFPKKVKRSKDSDSELE